MYQSILSPSAVSDVESTLGYHFQNKGLLVQAFTRSSYRNEHPDCPDNEVLELIGDSVLSLTVLSLFRKLYGTVTGKGLLTDWDEGKLSQLKTALVNKRFLANRMEKLALQNYLLMSKGDRITQIQNEASVCEDLFESLIGAVYVDSDHDFAGTSAVIHRMLNVKDALAVCSEKVHISYRNDLQEWCQNKKRNYSIPKYTDEELSEAHFRSTVSVTELELSAEGEGKNIKYAREAAAKKLYESICSLPSEEEAKEESPDGEPNYIGQLQELAQRRKQDLPVYTDQSTQLLPDNSHLFEISCTFMGMTVCGSAPSKKKAKAKAAEQMLEKVDG